jgi:L-asparaginase
MIPNEKTGVLESAKTARQLLSLVPKVKEIAIIDIVELFNIDSTDMTSEHWTHIAKEIYKRYHKYDGFIITHGTDTMADTGSALSLTFGKNLNKPIVLTGSQSYPEAIGTDAKFNLENAFRVICSDKIGVMISFGDFVYKAIRAQKKHESDFNAFNVPGFSRDCLYQKPSSMDSICKEKKEKSGKNRFKT